MTTCPYGLMYRDATAIGGNRVHHCALEPGHHGPHDDDAGMAWTTPLCDSEPTAPVSVPRPCAPWLVPPTGDNHG